MRQAIKWAALGIAAVTLAACANNAELSGPVDLGAFQLGHAVVIADNARKGPLSRDATDEQIEAAVGAELERRFSRYQGGRLYHLGISIDGYILAEPGIPVIASPKSALFASVNIWDDALGTKLTEEPKQIVVLESFSTDLVVGSGLTLSPEQQLENIAQNLVKEIEDWMNNHPEWFDYPVAGEGIPLEFIETERSRAEALEAATGAQATPATERPQPRPEQG
jgi:hypothetical protein